MDQDELLARGFEAHRGHLRSVAYRMLGSLSEADDAVQESWLRLSRADTTGVENLRGWLTTVVGRVCLDMLRMRRSCPEIAAIAGRSPAAVRQLASRARRRVQGAEAQGSGVSGAAPDAAAAGFGAEGADGAHAVAVTFSGRAQAVELALIDGVAGAVCVGARRPAARRVRLHPGGRTDRADRYPGGSRRA
jgi:hypothetical protein